MLWCVRKGGRGGLGFNADGPFFFCLYGWLGWIVLHVSGGGRRILGEKKRGRK